MSALINRPLPLIEMSAAHKISASGYQRSGCGYSAPMLGAGPVSIVCESTANARVHSFARRMHFTPGTAWLLPKAAKLDEAIWKNLKGLGYDP